MIKLALLLLSFNAMAMSPPPGNWTTIKGDETTVSHNMYYGTSAGDYQKSHRFISDTILLSAMGFKETTYMVFTNVDKDGRESIYSDELVQNVKHWNPIIGWFK